MPAPNAEEPDMRAMVAPWPKGGPEGSGFRVLGFRASRAQGLGLLGFRVQGFGV